MPTRQEVHERRSALIKALRTRCRLGELRVGSLAPSKRQLSEEFGVSATIVGQVMQELVAEGLFHTVARSGTYVGPSRPRQRERFVFLADDAFGDPDILALRRGFDDRIAERGGAVLSLSPQQFASLLEQRTFPEAVGVFEWGTRLGAHEWQELCGRVPARACYATLEDEAGERDSVAFDDVDGGRQATEHLVHLGHRVVAFLGLHPEQVTDDEPEWSRLREQGWREALREQGLRDDLVFRVSRPTGRIANPDQVEAARDAVKALLRHGEIEAVVTANDQAAKALLQELHARQILPARWPAIVSFDGDPELQGEALTSLRLPWEDVGKTVADLLWERARGELSSPEHRLVKMRLIPRLSCLPRWRDVAPEAIVADTLRPIPGAALAS